ncbi:hypothetical protein [Phyllobacterium endophyticum]|uniref:Uncharacterized protein n=1 Tax=Phyllobacterium endophyticum TaxID=1149773 RepID=A0A2P7ASE6_9HYPH|nr:hypothetical protein [Phyllobacterium endophyticum]MBB3236918.1 hypothetical protein [Phyllobacterium endophyticum]PSH57158.1 hypothetical protein CU100_18090 [Phyllobacterium endophyticum]TYR40437.1 hypothetical protein FY050_18110 [Phyllobacterium endophyticum]
MTNDRDPYYVHRCIDAAAHTPRRWIADIGLIFVLFAVVSLATASPGVFIEERQHKDLPMAGKIFDT